MKYKKLIILCFLISACAPRKTILKKGKIKLRYKYKEGTERVYLIKNRISTTNKFQMQSITTITDMEIKIKKKIRKKGDTIIIVTKFEDVKGTFKMGERIKPLEGIDFMKNDSSLVYIFNGNVVKRKEPSKIYEKIKKLSEFEDFMKFSDSNWLPEDSIISTGYKWKKISEVDTAEYIFEGIETIHGKNYAKLSFKGKLNLKKEQELGDKKIKMKMKGKYTGYILFDYKEGYEYKRYEKVSSEAKIEGELFNGNILMDMTLETKLTEPEKF